MLCPFCKEEIKDEAIKCKHCNSFLNTNNNIESEREPVPQPIQKKSIIKKIMLYAVLAFVLFIIVISLSSKNQSSNQTSGESPSIQKDIKLKVEPLTLLEQTKADKIEPTGELADAFNLMSKHTDIQREILEKSIKGKIVEWKLPVYEVSKKKDYYRIQTQESVGNPFDQATYKKYVGTFIEIKPRNDEEKNFIESIKTDEYIQIKGKISGTFMRSLKIEPAILYDPSKPRPAKEPEKQNVPTASTSPSAKNIDWKIISNDADINLLAKEVCSKTGDLSGNIKVKTCYKHDWKEWVNNIFNTVAGDEKSSIKNDSEVASPSQDTIIYSDGRKRLIFFGCRQHDCVDYNVFFLLDTNNKDMDIIWNKNNNIKYYGINSKLLEQNKVFERLNR